MSCRCLNHAFALLEPAKAESFYKGYQDECWIKPITLVDRIRQIFGAVLGGRLKEAHLCGEFARVYDAHYEEFLEMGTRTPAQLRALKLTEEQKVLTFLDCSEFPVQLARAGKWGVNPRVQKYLKSAQKRTWSCFWTLFELFGESNAKESTNLSLKRLAKLELTFYKRLGGIRKNSSGTITYLTIWDLVEEWSAQDLARKALFNTLKSRFKLISVADSIFKRVRLPSEEWQKAVAEEIAAKTRATHDKPIFTEIRTGISRSELGGSFSAVDLDSPKGVEGKKMAETVSLHKIDLNGKTVLLKPEDALLRYCIASNIHEMKKMNWILPDEAWDDLYWILYNAEWSVPLTTVLYLSGVCLNELLDPTNSKPIKEKWSITQETLHLLLEEKEEVTFTAFLETALLFTFSFTHLKLWLGGQELEKHAKFQIFKWMSGCTRDEKLEFFQRVVKLNTQNRKDEVLYAQEALKTCKLLQTDYNFSAFDTLAAWLHLQNLPLCAPPEQGGRWLTLDETFTLIKQIEEYCYGNRLGREMVLSVLLDHPIHEKVLSHLRDMKEEFRKAIVDTSAPFLPPFISTVLKNGSKGKMADMENIFLEGIEQNSHAAPIRRRLASRILSATLLENSCKEALLKCPLLNSAREPVNKSNPTVYEGWLFFAAPYGRTENGEAFTIGTWLEANANDPEFYRFEITMFQSLQSLKGRTFLRRVQVSKDNFAHEGLRTLFSELITAITPEFLADNNYKTWPAEVDYNDENEIENLLQVTLNNINAVSVKEKLEIFRSRFTHGAETAVKDSRELFRFLYTLKLQLRNPEPVVPEKKGKDLDSVTQRRPLPASHTEKILDAQKGNIFPLPNDSGATLLNASLSATQGNLFNIEKIAYLQEIQAFVYNILNGHVDPVKCEMEVVLFPAKPLDLHQPANLQVFLSYTWTHSSDLVLSAKAKLEHAGKIILFEEKLHLPPNFPTNGFENIAIILLCRLKYRFYNLPKHTITIAAPPASSPPPEPLSVILGGPPANRSPEAPPFISRPNIGPRFDT